MTDLSKFKKMPCFEIPETTEQVLLVESETNKGWYEIEFKTGAGWMRLARKCDYRRAFEYKSINSAVSKLRSMGWGSSIVIAEERV